MKREFINLYYELEKRGISTETFTGMIFTTVRSVENWYNQNSAPFRPMKMKISAVLGMPMDEVEKLFKFTNK